MLEIFLYLMSKIRLNDDDDDDDELKAKNIH